MDGTDGVRGPVPRHPRRDRPPAYTFSVTPGPGYRVGEAFGDGGYVKKGRDRFVEHPVAAVNRLCRDLAFVAAQMEARRLAPALGRWKGLLPKARRLHAQIAEAMKALESTPPWISAVSHETSNSGQKSDEG